LTESVEQRAALERLERGQVLLQAARDGLERVQAHLLIGDAQHDLAEYNAAQETFFKAEALARLLDNPQWLAEALVGRVRVAGGQSKYAEVLKVAKEAVRLARQANYPSTLAKTLYWLGNTEFYLGSISTARGHLEESLKVVTLLGDPLRLASTMTLLGRLEGQAGRLRRRIELLQDALKINQEFGYQKGIALCLTGLGWSTLLDGQFVESERLSLESLALFREHGSKWSVANALLNVSHARVALGKVSQAKTNLLEAFEIATQINSANLLLELLLGAARTEPDAELARQWVRIAVMHPNSTAELRSFAAPDIERLEVALKPVDQASLKNSLPEVKTRLSHND
jgi:tetratricopeptide (TPR) repeat protein